MGLVLKNGNLIDGTGKLVKDAVVVTEGPTIVAAGPAAEVTIPEAMHDEIDATGMTILPGLMDLHAHLWIRDSSDSLYQTAEKRALIDETDTWLGIRMATIARETLEFGFTTIRDMGAPRDINIDVSRAERDGIFNGPRIIPTATIGMSSIPGKPGTHGAQGLGYTGPIETRKGARQKIVAGAEVIHVIATGAGYGQFGPKMLTLTVEEMQAAIEETHKLGRLTTAHANNAPGIRNAVIAGTQCVEHGQWLYEDDDLIKMMADQRVGWVPTLRIHLAADRIREARARGEKSGYPEYFEPRALAMVEPHRRSFEKAMAAGVLVATGSDLGGRTGDSNAVELEWFVRFGATPMQAIEAATRVAAEVIKMDDRFGTVEPGKEADIVLVRKDPLNDIRTLQDKENILLVLKSGVIVVDRRDEARQR
jgi:imidazolonepropionase-like amidohydrolase